MKKLELKHVLPYLAYGVKCQYFGIVDVLEYHKFVGDPFVKIPENSNGGFGFKIAEIKEIKLYRKYWKAYIGTYHSHLKSFVNGYDFKLCLIPLSALDTQILINDLHGKMSDAILDWIDYFNSDNANKDISILCAPYPVIEWCFENYVDVFSLIEQGLAIDNRLV